MSFKLVVFSRRLVGALLLNFLILSLADGDINSSSGESGKQGLKFSVGERGLDSLSYDGQSLLASPQSGDLQPAKSLFRAAADAIFNHLASLPIVTPKKQADTIDLSYPWARISCAYRAKGDNGITMQVQIANAGTESLEDVSLRLVEINFPKVPRGGTLEAGMFGFGFKGEAAPLYQYPLVADPRFVTPIIRIDYGNATLNFCSDDLECTIGVPYSTNPLVKTSYPFTVTCHNIKPGKTKTFAVSLRFGPPDSSVRNLSNDVLEHYKKKYPFALNWKDRRPIGGIFLANSGAKVTTNPRRWIMNGGKLDISTEEGKASFREALLKLADNSVQVLKDANAQGMITWNPEGQEFPEACYYGDPRLTPTLAPEMEFKGEGTAVAIDEYFAKFRAAGLKVGVCIRPQQITIVDGKPRQGVADDEHSAQVLEDKIAYAKQRWGCTLFYVDSTTAPPRSLNPDVFEAVAEKYPDVLLIPENESMRYFAYSAPYNNYWQWKVTSTPAGARVIYPKAFSVLRAPGGDEPQDHDALVAAIRNGDILLFNGWYNNPGIARIKDLYREAAVQEAAAKR